MWNLILSRGILCLLPKTLCAALCTPYKMARQDHEELDWPVAPCLPGNEGGVKQGRHRKCNAESFAVQICPVSHVTHTCNTYSFGPVLSLR